ncbi:MAG: hypothetical protein WDO14_07370 [Bacteroidota bacterium]
MERQCTECGQRIIGRSDKKFCNDQCRTAWHNRLKGEEYIFMKSTNNILKRNRNILASLIDDGRTEIRSVTLTKLGFQFGYFTRTQKDRNGYLSHFCYDVGYVPVTNGVYLLKSNAK